MTTVQAVRPGGASTHRATSTPSREPRCALSNRRRDKSTFAGTSSRRRKLSRFDASQCVDLRLAVYFAKEMPTGQRGVEMATIDKSQAKQLLTEVVALRDDVAHEGAATFRRWRPRIERRAF